MSRKSRIPAVFALVGLLSVSVSGAAFAGSPLLSGYGGPGAGEQAILGSTLLGGHSGGGASGGSSGTGSSSGSSVPGTVSQSSVGGTGATSRSTSTGAGSGRAGSEGFGSPRGRPTNEVVARSPRTATSAFVYPSSLRSASASSSAFGISGGDFLVLLAAIAMLTLMAMFTLRVSRLQR